MVVVLCFLMAVAVDVTAADVTFTQDVLPILQENCIECHRPGGANLGGMVAPMSFTTYREARPWARAIARAVKTRVMPPWDASQEHRDVFEGERYLTDEEINVIITWVQTGAKRGKPSDAPKPLEFNTGWLIGEPDMILSMPEPFWVPDNLLDDTKYFRDVISEEDLPTDRWIRASEFRPGSESVHHIIVRPFETITRTNYISS